jgi:predicted metal-dependent hydrolase
LSSLIDSLATAEQALEMYLRGVSNNTARRLLDRLANRIVKILTETKNSTRLKNTQRLAG